MVTESAASISIFQIDKIHNKHIRFLRNFWVVLCNVFADENQPWCVRSYFTGTNDFHNVMGRIVMERRKFVHH